MTDLPARSPSSASREVQRTRALTGALLGTLLWLECIALGVPTILLETRGYNLIPVAALAGALLGLTRGRRVLLATAAALAIVLALIAYTPVIRRPARSLIRSDVVGARAVQAIVVLSGGITSDGHLKPPTVDRTLTGLALIRRGVASTLIVSRERRDAAGHAATSDADQQRLVALLDRPVRLLIVDSVFSTRDEAVRMRALARALDITSIAVVTSPTHTYRACATFEKVGFAVTCVPSESRDVALGTLRLATDRVRAFQLCLYEWAALAKYRASGWI
ncbi:MAG: YdcF family protein [Gemmatimonadota bacterium]|nr:YdcF family protein [Gemmatimonadota bacterium]